MAKTGLPFVVLYRWRIHPGKEQDFIDSWTRLSELLYSLHGSLGSRLHRGHDGIWYSYAQWPSSEARTRAFSAPPVDPAASETLKACVAEHFPEVILEPVSDLLVVATASSSANSAHSAQNRKPDEPKAL